LERSVKIFQNPGELAEKLSEDLVIMINDSATKNKPFTIALSGGSTPELLFSLLGKKYAKSVHWNSVHFFWGDERCVAPDNPGSNYGMTKKNLFDHIVINSVNIHRIRGEDEPQAEAFRYSSEISQNTEERNGLPQFDLVMLGLGDDGHTASIFPGYRHLLTSEKICEEALNPHNQQRRITITGRVINNADKVIFLVTGKKKAEIIESIFKSEPEAFSYPASYILPVYGSLEWYIDSEAGSLL
jgi:6-phosphogluconolactonase